MPHGGRRAASRWSLPAEEAARIALPAEWPERVTREWAWGGATGEGVRVCVLDSGVERGHPLVDDVEGSVAVVSEGDESRVEGAAESMGVRIVMSWLVGALIPLGTFNHAVVSTIEIVFGLRYGGAGDVGDLFRNLGLAVTGNLTGGLLLGTFARTAQALAGSRET